MRLCPLFWRQVLIVCFAAYNEAVEEEKSDKPDFSYFGRYAQDSPARRNRFGCAMQCTCGFTLERLLLKTHAPILKAHEESAKGEMTPTEEVFIANKIVRTPA